MKKYNLFFLLVLVVACNNQNGKGVQNDSTASQKEKKAAVVLPKLPKTNAPSNASISSSIQDRNGIIWFTTSGAGIFRFDGKAFVNYTEADGLSNNYVWSVCEAADGKIWFGTSEGLSCYDGTKFTVVPIHISGDTTLLPDNRPGHEFTVDQYGYPDPEDAVWDIELDRNGVLWFGTWKGVFYEKGNGFAHFTVTDGVANTSGAKIANVEKILEDQDGNLWFGGRMTEGVFRYDGKSLTNMQPDTNWVWPVLQQRNGNIWFSNWGGAYCYNDTTFTNYRSKDSTLKDVTNMLEDRAGNLWFTCDRKTKGICRYNGNTFDHFESDSTANYADVWSIMEDSNGKIWFGTRNLGLYSYDGNSFTYYSE